jgi:hypothetical protein
MSDPIHPLYTTVIEALEEKGTRYLEVEPGRVTFRLAGSRGAYDFFVYVHEDLEQIVCACSLGFRAPAEKRVALAEAVTRANWGMRLGAFDLDHSDGEVRFRIGIDVEGGLFVGAMLNNMIGAAFSMGERYHDAFLRVVYGDADPESVIAEADSEGEADGE